MSNDLSFESISAGDSSHYSPASVRITSNHNYDDLDNLSEVGHQNLDDFSGVRHNDLEKVGHDERNSYVGAGCEEPSNMCDAEGESDSICNHGDACHPGDLNGGPDHLNLENPRRQPLSSDELLLKMLISTSGSDCSLRQVVGQVKGQSSNGQGSANKTIYNTPDLKHTLISS